MSDTGGEQPKPSIKEVAQAQTDRLSDTTLSPEARERATKYREERKKGKSGIDVLKSAAEASKKTSFSSREATALEMNFGGGKAKEDLSDPINPKTEIDPSARAEEKVNHETARKTISELNAYLQYSDIADVSRRTNKSIDQVIADRVSRGDGSIKSLQEYNAAREKGLDALLASNGIREMFPDLEGSSVAERREYIEAVLAEKVEMRNAVATRVKDIAERARNLPEVTSDEDLKNAEKAKKENEQIRDERITQLIGSIEADQVVLTDAQKQQIKDMVSKGATPDQIVGFIRTLTVDTVPNAAQFARYNELKTARDEAFARWEKAKPAATVNKNAKPNPAAEAASNALLAAYNNAETALAGVQGTIDQNRTGFDRYSQLSNRYSLDKTDTSGVGVRLSEIMSAQGKIRDSERIIADKQANPNKSELATRNNRLLQESALIDSLDNVFSDAAISTFEGMTNKYIEAESKRLKEDAEKQTTKDDKAIIKAMDTRWISFDPDTRKPSKDTNQINFDVRMLAYEGEEGIKRLLVRELGFTLVDEHGTPIPGPVDYRTVDLSTLSDEQKKRLEAVYTKHGEALRDKLFKDMFRARSLGGKLKDRIPGTDKVNLKKHEWELLEQNFSGKLNEALRKSEKAQRVLKNLEAQGIRPDFKMKWLLYALLAAGGAGLMLTGIGPAGAALASAAPAVGGAAWNGLAA